MEIAVIVLSFVLLLQSAIIAVLAGCIPFLWSRSQKHDAQIEKLDEVVDQIGSVMTEVRR